MLGIIAIILNIILFKTTPDTNTTRMSLIFMAIGVLSIIFSTLHIYPLGSLTGTSTQLINSIFLFIFAPIALKTTNIVFKEKKDFLGVNIALFIIARLAWEIVFPRHITFSSDHLAFTGLFTFLILSQTIDINIKSLTSIKKPSQIIHVIGIIASLLCIFMFYNNSAKILTLILLPSAYIFQYVISKRLPKNIAEYISTALPIVTGIVMTISIYLLTSFKVIGSTGFWKIIWECGMFLDSLANSITPKIFFVGWGWGNINDLIMNEVWLPGISNTHLNESATNKLMGLINGLGINHVHNEISQYFIAGGILFVALYIAMWGYVAWCARKNKLAIAVLTVICALYTVWFNATSDIVLLIVMLGVVVANKNTSAKNTTKPIIKNALALYSTIGLVLYCGFTSIFYIPYVKCLETQISKEAFYGTWYTGEKTGFRTEKLIFRKQILKYLNQLSDNKKISQNQMTYLIDMLDILKKKSNMQNSNNNLELCYIYTFLFNIKSAPQIEKIRQREFPHWTTAVSRVIQNYSNRPDLIVTYLQWHTNRGFDEAVSQITKQALAVNPNNAVALYWRGLLFIKNGNALGERMIEDAYKNNINRYQTTNSKYYEKYKHLSDPAYR